MKCANKNCEQNRLTRRVKSWRVSCTTSSQRDKLPSTPQEMCKSSRDAANARAEAHAKRDLHRNHQESATSFCNVSTLFEATAKLSFHSTVGFSLWTVVSQESSQGNWESQQSMHSRHTHELTMHLATPRQSWLLKPLTHACLNFITLTFRALHRNECVATNVGVGVWVGVW